MSWASINQRRTLKTKLYRKQPYCAHCYQPAAKNKLTIDHIIPRTRNGKNGLWNLILACEPCNTARGHMGFIQWVFAERTIKMREANIAAMLVR